MQGGAKVVGFFEGTACEIMINGSYFGTIWDLKYTGKASKYDDTRLYLKDGAGIWLDYAVYK